MPRSIDNIDTMLRKLLVHSIPEAGGGSGRDRNATLLLLLHPVHGGIAVVDFTDFVRDTGIEQDAFSGRRLTGIDVSHDADIAITINGCCTGHCLNL